VPQRYAIVYKKQNRASFFNERGKNRFDTQINSFLKQQEIAPDAQNAFAVVFFMKSAARFSFCFSINNSTMKRTSNCVFFHQLNFC
jgi:hypothetical protein